MKWFKIGEDFFFQLIFFVVNGIILIGEYSQKAAFLIISQLYFLAEKIISLALYFLKKIKGFFYLIKKPKLSFKSIKIKPIKIIQIKKVLSHIKIPFPRIRIFLPSFSVKFRFFVFGCLTTLMIILIYQGYLFVNNLPSPYNIGKVNYPLSSHIYDRNNLLLYEIYREQNRTPIKLSQLPNYVIDATIAAEDKNFYRHRGISFFGGIIRAVKDMILQGELQGGSTITQQLVKIALLTPERTIIRKIKEIILAIWVERIYSKAEILEMYFNQVPYGGTAYGIEEAAKTYFGKSASSLSLAEAATLAGLPKAPSLYSPYNNPRAALSRRNTILKAMVDQKLIDKKEYEMAVKQPLKVIPPKTTIKAPHFVFYLRQQLEEKFGIQKVEEGGLKVISTLDLNIQKEGERILKEELNKIAYLNVTNGGILVIRPATGEILAMVGSVDYFSYPSGAFNVTTASRQPGSAIKPVMYSLALEKGFTAATVLDDTPIVFNIPGSKPYRPVNYDGRFHGKVPLRYALANSYNVPAVKTLAAVGVEDFINHARKMGITTWDDKERYGLSLTLGGGEVKMIDMVEAFGVFANLGKKTALSSWIKVEDMTSGKVWESSLDQKQVLDEGIAYIISDILADNFARQWAFGRRSSLEIPGYKVAVKTGTTNDKKDNWTIGYTPEFLVAVWVGNNDNTPMNPYLTSGITGAAPIWNRVMSYLLKNYGDGQVWLKKPENVVEKICYFGRKEYFIAGTEKRVFCKEKLFQTTPTPTP